MAPAAEVAEPEKGPAPLAPRLPVDVARPVPVMIDVEAEKERASRLEEVLSKYRIELRSTASAKGKALAQEISTLPFRIGRIVDEGATEMAVPNDLSLRETRPYYLSRAHYEIDVSEDGTLLVRDLRSRLGTTVNGVSIGRVAPSLKEALRVGENKLHMGGRHSPHDFILTIAELLPEPPLNLVD